MKQNNKTFAEFIYVTEAVKCHKRISQKSYCNGLLRLGSMRLAQRISNAQLNSHEFFLCSLLETVQLHSAIP